MFCSPCYGKDEIVLERVQMRLTRTFPGLQDTSYGERLDILGFFPGVKEVTGWKYVRLLRSRDGADSQNRFFIDRLSRGHKFNVEDGVLKEI